MPEKRKRNNRVRTWLSDSEYAAFCTKVEKSRLGKEEFLRRLIYTGEVRTPPGADYMRLVREVNAIGNNINQIAHLTNTSGKASSASLNECYKLMEEVLKIIREGLCGNREETDSG